MAITAYYTASVCQFLNDDAERILGVLTSQHHHAVEEQERWAWIQQVSILRNALSGQPDGRIFLEFHIPRMGKRADAVLVLHNIVFVLEFKIGAKEHTRSAFSQVEDYALDLKNFHEGSHSVPVVPVLVSTDAESTGNPDLCFAEDLVASPIGTNATDLGALISDIAAIKAFPTLDYDQWIAKGYKPTPTIIEAAQVLYRTHSVTDISRSDADAKNLDELSDAVNAVIDQARRNRSKAICFVTGVPGSGKTLAGLNLATRRSDEHLEEHAVFLSGNGPLVDVLREALARDSVQRDGVSKKTAERKVRSFIQNIHHFRDHYVGNHDIPLEKVVVFDEAQRAWSRHQLRSFMKKKRSQPNFDMSEPEFLVSVMNRHLDWCTIVCLVGGGQEINTGEAGISEWMAALQTRFPDWDVYVSGHILQSEYASQFDVNAFVKLPRVSIDEHLHLAVSIRSFRAEKVSELVGHILDNESDSARVAFESIQTRYPIFLTRDVQAARGWLRSRARGTERFGLVASSGAQRLRPESIHIKTKIEPAYWFLNDTADVRSSYYLEDVATEFAIQGLELDWVGMCWDGDFHHNHEQWTHQAFKGTKWHSVNDQSRRLYLKNAYRVLLTRARQGMIIFVPRGDSSDHTRPSRFYEGTFDFLRACGIPMLGETPGPGV